MILEFDKWLPVLKKNIPVAILFFSLGCVATFIIFNSLVLESKNAKIEILQTQLDTLKDDTERINNKENEIKNQSGQIKKLESLNEDLKSQLNALQNKKSDAPQNENIDSMETVKNEISTSNDKISSQTKALTVGPEIRNIEKKEHLSKENINTQDSQPEKIKNIDENETIRMLLDKANHQVQAKKFTTPAEDNAYATYQKILTIKNDQTDAIHGIDDIFNIYIRFAKNDANKGDFEKAKKYLERAKNIKSDSQDLQKVTQFIADKENSVKIHLEKSSYNNLPDLKHNLQAISDKKTNLTTLKVKPEIELSYIKRLNQISYSQTGLNLPSNLAAEFCDFWIEHYSNIPIDKLQDVASFAYSSFGLNLTSTNARNFVKLWFANYSDIDFSKFKQLFNSAKSLTGLNLTDMAAKDYALKNIRKIK